MSCPESRCGRRDMVGEGQRSHQAGSRAQPDSMGRCTMPKMVAYAELPRHTYRRGGVMVIVPSCRAPGEVMLPLPLPLPLPPHLHTQRLPAAPLVSFTCSKHARRRCFGDVVARAGWPQQTTVGNDGETSGANQDTIIYPLFV